MENRWMFSSPWLEEKVLFGTQDWPVQDAGRSGNCESGNAETNAAYKYYEQANEPSTHTHTHKPTHSSRLSKGLPTERSVK